MNWHMKKAIIVLFSICSCTLVLSSIADIRLDTVVPRSKPGLKSPKKLWWAKEITPDYHVAGRLSERQIKYAADAGFKTILSLYRYDTPGDFGGEYLPNTDEEKILVQQSAMQFEQVLSATGPGGGDWATVGAVEQMTAKLPSLKKPVLLHCNRAYTISFVLFMYMANCSRHDPTYVPQINSENFYRMTAMMGIDFTMDFTMDVVSKVTGEPEPENPPRPNAEPEEWYDYWLAHPVYKTWFTAGQIRDTHLSMIKEAGFKHVINMRFGMTYEGKPSQESVTLINIKDGTPTYGDSKSGARQEEKTLKAQILDKSKPNTAIAPDSKVNYEARNMGEFGDEVGYNEEIERQALEASGLKYYHMPVDSNGGYSPELFGKYKDELLRIGKTGEPVLVHCASAHRVAYMSVLTTALLYDKDLTWALKRIRELGFEVSHTKQKDVLLMFSAWLDRANYNKTVEAVISPKMEIRDRAILLSIVPVKLSSGFSDNDSNTSHVKNSPGYHLLKKKH